MIEGKRVVAGEATLSRAVSMERTAEGGQIERTGDAMEALVRNHSRMVYRIAYAALRRHQDAEDATQETFLRVLRYSGRLAAVDDPKTWLARIAWRVAVDRNRSSARRQEIAWEDSGSPPEVTSNATAADTAMQGAHVGAVLEKLIAALPRKLRDPLILSTVEEMSPREVAATLGINEAAVRSRVFRARRILKEKLTQPDRRQR